MARVKLSEFRAKSMLIDDYQGVALHLDTLDTDIEKMATDTSYVIKVDQGVKKRGKQGLLKLNVSKNDAKSAVEELAAKGYSRFIAESMLAHEDNEEHYLSLERTRNGIAISYSPHGGIDIEDSADSVTTVIYPEIPSAIPTELIEKLVQTMNDQHLSLIEINPLVIQGNQIHLLDAAVLADSAGEYFAKAWSETDVVEARQKSPEEEAVAELDDNSPSAFSLRVLNPNGSLWLLLSGGGASITIADEAQNQGKGTEIGNYGEYSGGPTTEESYLYTKELLSLMLKSNAPKKALVIAGGVANFTDVKKTFKGVIQAMTEVTEQMKEANIKVFVRRGGPNEKEGLANMKSFLEEHELFGSVAGSDIVLTDAITRAMEYVS
jgi:succinyl-CoA synthetase beta subunit